MKKWVTRKLNKDNAVAISQRYDLPMLIAMLLDIRGITDEDAIIDFLSNDTLTASPFEIKDMDKAYGYYEYALRLARANIIILQQDDTFKPEDGATRAQLASIVDKLIYPRHR